MKFILVFVCLLSGCIVIDEELKAGIDSCAINGGIKKIKPHLKSSTFTCENGATFLISMSGKVLS